MIDTECISGPKAYQAIIKKFQQYYNIPIDQYTIQHAHHFIKLHAPTLTKASHRWYAASLNYHYRHHLNIDLKLKVPYQSLPVPKIHSLKEVKTFFDQLPQQYKNIFRLIYGYGLKISEALNLSISDIDLNNGLILLSKGRQIKLSKIAYDHIEKHIQGRKRQFLSDQSKKQTYRKNSFKYLMISFERQPLFASRKKTLTNNRVIRPQITPSTVHAIARNINKKLQPHKSITTMSLRHSFAIEVLHKGTTIIELMKILGHSNIKQTLQYEKLYRAAKVTSPADNLYPLITLIYFIFGKL